MPNKMQVRAIEVGTVIDHIPQGMGIRILKFFQLTDKPDCITIGLNLRTASGDRKDIIKIENTQFTREQANQLSLFAGEATINVIDNYNVVDKYTVNLPETVVGVLSCPNSNCITHEEQVSSRFHVKVRAEVVNLSCHYCEKSYQPRVFKELL
ncbi:aspartate carbamoyltransferase regulatory subunit [Sinobacterium caligoides]|uniref:Aspartate carbamoyltransferase regulatory chain n=1 Tax=Sinobacterium caligoides TaxID=933926 RepID=A0A3N2DZT6_9GAMM|nr:aspartate carbamoyltransferase regulatory subunit [Sinobacterium caligoides]ROS05287.1 aspartate carbamoyltransferase regulatory subunit [Sinobacterium caligoides]